MIVDFREFEEGAELAADICIIGGGAAGIALARSLIGSKLRVCLLESGGLAYDEDVQALYEGENIGREYYSLDTCRLRFLGGSTNHWGGWCGPLTPIDFEAKPWVPHSGWPLRLVDLEPYYEAAQTVCELGSFVYDERLWSAFDMEAVPFDSEKLALRFWRQRWPFSFGEAYGAELEQADNLQLVLNTNVVRIEANAEGTAIDGLALRSLDGKRARAVARRYVLACGGIENARLLLASNDVRPNGLGNDNDLVGRFFMDHLGTRCATILTSDPMAFAWRYGKHSVETSKVWAGLCPSAAVQRQARSLNVGLWVDTISDPDSGPMTARNLWHTLKRGDWPDELGRSLLNIVTDLDDLAAHVTHRSLEDDLPPYPPKEIFFYTEAEQSPNPDSRVTLSDERDPLGMPRAQLDWRLSAIDKHSIRIAVETVGAELGRLNIARVKMEDWLLDGGDGWPDNLAGAYHHVGTTRMSDDPRSGVVDRDCRLHGLANLYVAGSSVFPTEGHINPTLTIVALALRLGDHLSETLS